MDKPTVEQVKEIIYNPDNRYPHITREQAVESAVFVTIKLIGEMNKDKKEVDTE